MGRPRGTQQSLELSGLKDKRPTYYASRNWETGAVIPSDVRVKPPKNYQKETKKAWEAMVNNLIHMGALSYQDCPALGIMFDVYDRYIVMKKRLEEFDKDAQWDDDKWVSRRYTMHRMMTNELAEFNKAASKFGCTPTERSRLICEQKKEKEKDPLEIITEGL